MAPIVTAACRAAAVELVVRVFIPVAVGVLVVVAEFVTASFVRDESEEGPDLAP
jgi:hypothetical protein